MKMMQDSSLRVLFLLNLLFEGEFSKSEIIKKFKENNIEIKKTSISNYIKKLQEHGIKVSIRKEKNANIYSINKEQIISIDQDELEASSDVKKILTNQKKADIIPRIMRIFYKFSLFVEDKSIRAELADFGYYSKINWLLVKQLKQHCINKDIITIDYLLPEGKNMYLTIHADMIKMGDWSERLYLQGILQGDNKLSQLPLDKIFMIKKVVKKNIPISLTVDALAYKISKSAYDKAGLDKKEILYEIKNDIVTIKRPLDDTFFTVQRLMHFCPDLFYVSDKKIKELIKEKLYTLKDIYDKEIDK